MIFSNKIIEESKLETLKLPWPSEYLITPRKNGWCYEATKHAKIHTTLLKSLSEGTWEAQGSSFSDVREPVYLRRS